MVEGRVLLIAAMIVHLQYLHFGIVSKKSWKLNIIMLDNIHLENFRYKKYMVLDPLGVVSGTRGEGARIRSDTATSSIPALQDAPTTLQVGCRGINLYEG